MCPKRPADICFPGGESANAMKNISEMIIFDKLLDSHGKTTVWKDSHMFIFFNPRIQQVLQRSDRAFC